MMDHLPTTSQIYFITGIDTGVGKSYATGLLARYFLQQGLRVITQKLVQTDSIPGQLADDIVTHRRLMEVIPQPEDQNGTTCPLVFEFPASPHLAAKLEDQTIDPSLITSATQQLLERYETVLLEGAGGFYVPLTPEYLVADYIQQQRYPLILVTTGKLGSINHTLLTLEAVQNRKIPLAGIIVNRHFSNDKIIYQESIDIFKRYLEKAGRKNALVEIPTVHYKNIPDINFSPLFS